MDKDREILRGLLAEYDNLDGGVAKWNLAEKIRKLTLEIKKKKVDFYLKEYGELLSGGSITDVKRMGVLLRQATKEYERSKDRYKFDVEAIKRKILGE